MTVRAVAVGLAAAVVAVAMLSPDAIAHGTHNAASLSSAASTYSPPPDATWWEALYGTIEHQMKVLLNTARSGSDITAAVAIAMFAFGYGVLHAIGPGHGKLLLASYMAATHSPAARGVAMAFAAAAIQAAIAISIVVVVALGFRSAADVVPALQSGVSTVSLLLLIAFGLLIVARQLSALNWLPRPVARLAPATGCSCCGQHGHDGRHARDNRHGHHQHEHHHHSEAERQSQQPHSAIGAVGVTLSMGARPCTSAFAILLLALVSDMLALGIAATLAMALGVACTLVLVAVSSVDIRQYARVALKRTWLPDNATAVVTLVAGTLLISVAFVGLVQAATR